ncbi:MAG: CDP-alcohol phosphatidyltransferase family protein [Ignavibacteria bacterium]
MEKVDFNDWKKFPNLISIFRIFFIPLIIYLFEDMNQNRWLIIITLIIFSILDNLDGFAARKLNQITELGKVIDPVVDKLFVITIAFLTFQAKLIPFWFLVLVIFRDISIMLAGIIFLKKIKRVPQSDFIGKLTVGAIGFIFLISLLNFQKVNFIYSLSLAICSFLIFLSLINYGYKQFFKRK